MDLQYKIHKKGRDFTQVENSMLRNPELSMRAKGLLTLLLSFPNDFEPASKHLLACIAEGRTALQSVLKELREFRYALLKTERNSLGQIRSRYDIFEDPNDNPGESKSTGSRNTARGEADGGKPVSLIRHDVNTNLSKSEPNEKAHWGRTTDDWIEALQEKGLKPRKSGNGWTAHCPCHQDRKRSLCIRPGDKREVVAICHAGCTFEAIAEFLFPGLPSTSNTYTYSDMNDKPLYRVVRDSAVKDFFVQTFVGTGWANGMKDGVKRVPYRLPQLLEAIKQGQEIWIVEGEKDAETFRRKGMVATCNVFGAGSWIFTLNNYFKGAKVTIVADKDEAGMKHALAIRNQLAVVAKSLRVIKAAGDETVKDSTDHFEAGYTCLDFVEIEFEG